MGKDDKKKTPKPIQEFFDKSKKAVELANTAEYNLIEGYQHATKKVLLDKKTGRVNYDILKKDDKQLEFANKMADFYIEKGAEYFGIKKENIKDEFQKDMILSAYAKVGRQQIIEQVREHKNKFTFDAFNGGLKDEITKVVRNQMHTVARSHLNEKHINDIVKYTSTDKLVNKDLLKVDDAVGLLEIHKEYGVVTGKHLQQAFKKNDYVIKKEHRVGYKT